MIRYIGHPDLEANRPFLMPWVDRLAEWIAQGERPTIFMHMPYKGDALALARLWNELLSERAPGVYLPGLRVNEPQLGLF